MRVEHPSFIKIKSVEKIESDHLSSRLRRIVSLLSNQRILGMKINRQIILTGLSTTLLTSLCANQELVTSLNKLTDSLHSLKNQLTPQPSSTSTTPSSIDQIVKTFQEIKDHLIAFNKSANFADVKTNYSNLLNATDKLTIDPENISSNDIKTIHAKLSELLINVTELMSNRNEKNSSPTEIFIRKVLQEWKNLLNAFIFHSNTLIIQPNTEQRIKSAMNIASSLSSYHKKILQHAQNDTTLKNDAEMQKMITEILEPVATWTQGIVDQFTKEFQSLR